ncbi:hypothetical protein IVA96_07155 [Bradyrhizobium sp. 159]|nr:hypothetical protein [Bradyrhizobium sp. 159]MCK1616437.1 hypothetical protein [Bradyrhizobium sp. 159]
MQLFKGKLEHAVTTTILVMTLGMVWGAILTGSRSLRAASELDPLARA